MPEGELIKWAIQGGIAVVLVIGGVRKWYVWGWMYEQERTRADKLEEMLDKATDALRASANHIERRQ